MEIDVVLAELGSEDVTVRRGAAEALARGGAELAVVPLVRACADPDEEVREWSGAALETLGPPAAEAGAELAELLGAAAPAAYWAATLLGRLQADAAAWVPALTQAVGHPDPSVRQRAAWALGQVGPAAAAAIGTLEAVAEEGDPRLARLAATALEQIRP